MFKDERALLSYVMDLLLSRSLDMNTEKRSWWRGLIVPFVVLVASITVTAMFVKLTVQPARIAGLFSSLANGNPALPWQKRPTLWDPDLLTSITLSFGDLTFAQAKAVDVAWDLVVGRGGQFLASALVYNTLRRSLALMMERGPVRIPLVASVTFDKSSLETFGNISKELYASSPWKKPSEAVEPESPRKGEAFVSPLTYWLFAIAYVLAFGTLVSAMTGYQAGMESLSIDPVTHDLVLSTSLQETSDILNVADGHRVGLARYNGSAAYTLSGTPYDKAWLEPNTICQPLKTYHWGFSSLLLFIFCLSSLTFAVVILSLRLQVIWHSRSDRLRKDFTLYRDILDLSLAIRNIHPTAESISDRSLLKIVKDDNALVRLETKPLPPFRSYTWNRNVLRAGWRNECEIGLKEDDGMEKIARIPFSRRMSL